MKLHGLAKQPGDGMTVKSVVLDLSFNQAFKQGRAEAYTPLLLDATRGNLSLFFRRDEQEAA